MSDGLANDAQGCEDMGMICLEPEKMLSLLNEIGSHRALTDDETDILEAIVCRGHRSTGVRQRWTSDMDQALLTAAQVDGGIARHAKAIGVKPMSCYMRLNKLRSTMGKAKGDVRAMQSIQTENGAG